MNAHMHAQISASIAISFQGPEKHSEEPAVGQQAMGTCKGYLLLGCYRFQVDARALTVLGSATN